jgi:NhaP-type Na+/H+ or K+/H+ antiporter
LVRTFFYVLLGLILDLSAITWRVGLVGLLLFALAVVVRRLVVEGFGRLWCNWSPVEPASVSEPGRS